MATQASLDLAQQLYVAYYGRPADPAGQTFWADAFDAAGDDLTDALAAFGASTEYTDNYGSLTNTALVEGLYQQLFSRAGDAEGIAFYVDLLDTGAATLASIAKQIADGAQGTDATALANKVTVANTYTDTVSSTGETYDSSEIAAAQAILAAVDDSSASVTAGNTAATAAASPPTFTVSGSATQADEGETLTFTVTASKAVDADTAFTFGVSGDTVDGVATAASTNDYTPASGTVTIPAGDTSISFDVSITADQTVENLEGIEIVVLDSTLTTVGTARALLQDGDDVGATFTLTTGVDTVTGSAQDDSIIATIGATGGTADDTLSALDVIDGGDGNDTITINDLEAVNYSTRATISNVETATVRSTGGTSLNTSTWSGLTTLNSTQSGAAVTLTAAATTGVNVSGTVGAVTVNGGSTVGVTGGATTTNINVGGAVATNPAGNVTITHSALGANSITADAGTGADITVTASGATTGGIYVGTSVAATGAVTVSNTGAAYTTATANSTLGTISVTGGTTVNVSHSASSSTAAAAADTTNNTITQGAVNVTGGSSTTTVNVSQDDQATATNAVTAVTGVAGTNVVTFVAMAATETTVVDGLTFTAAKALTAAEVAAAFANISASGTQVSGGPTANGTFTGTLSANWTSGAASGATVTFSETVAGAGAGFVILDTAAAGNVATVATAGTAAVAGVTGIMGVANGVVTIADGGTASLSSVTVDGYGNGSSVNSNVITSLSLANSGASTMALTTAATGSLALTVNDVDGNVSVDGGGASITGLSVTTDTVASAFALTAAAVTSLSVAGDAALDLSGSTLTALTTVSVSGSAGLTLTAPVTVTAIDASGTSGNNTITFNPTVATYSGGTGTDAIITNAVAPTKAIDLGEGNDSATLSAGTTAMGTGGSISGGAGTQDTLIMAAADAAVADNSTVFATGVTNFEVLTLLNATGAQTVDASVLGSYNAVVVAGIADTGATDDVLTVNNIASGGSVTVTAAIVDADAVDNDLVIGVSNAATGTADVANLTVSNAASMTTDGVVIASVETVNITATDSDTALVPTPNAIHTLDVTATSATSITVSGNAAGLVLDNTAHTALTTLNASAFTGVLTVTAAGTTATTITGGSGGDIITASTAGDTIDGGAGNDTLIANNLAQLTGGAGNDTFDMSTNVVTNVNSYATIVDASSGDIVDSTGGQFNAAGITLAATAVFQDFANAAVNINDANNALSWFQYDGNTYVIQDANNGDTDFQNGTDMIIQLSGLVDLSQASFNATNGTIQLA